MRARSGRTLAQRTVKTVVFRPIVLDFSAVNEYKHNGVVYTVDSTGGAAIPLEQWVEAFASQGMLSLDEVSGYKKVEVRGGLTYYVSPTCHVPLDESGGLERLVMMTNDMLCLQAGKRVDPRFLPFLEPDPVLRCQIAEIGYSEKAYQAFESLFTEDDSCVANFERQRREETESARELEATLAELDVQPLDDGFALRAQNLVDVAKKVAVQYKPFMTSYADGLVTKEEIKLFASTTVIRLFRQLFTPSECLVMACASGLTLGVGALLTFRQVSRAGLTSYRLLHSVARTGKLAVARVSLSLAAPLIYAGALIAATGLIEATARRRTARWLREQAIRRYDNRVKPYVNDLLVAGEDGLMYVVDGSPSYDPEAVTNFVAFLQSWLNSMAAGDELDFLEANFGERFSALTADQKNVIAALCTARYGVSPVSAIGPRRVCKGKEATRVSISVQSALRYVAYCCPIPAIFAPLARIFEDFLV